MIDLKYIFKQVSKQQLKNNETKINKNFSELFGINHKKKQGVYCVISLSCVHCIDLIPELKVLSNKRDVFNLITDGEVEENTEIKKQFKFDFPLFTYNKPLSRVNITKTPTSLLVNEYGEITKNSFTPQISDILRILNEVK